MARIVEELDAGVVARSLDPEAIAAAIRAVLDRPVEARSADRERVARVAEERYTWPVAAAGYRRLVRDLVGEVRDLAGEAGRS